jgi:hypothetical protein
VTGDPLGTTISQILANVALYRSDRVFYTGKALKVLIPAIAEQGTAGGLGFTADGVITVRPDGPLTTICATLGVAENPGQQTGLIEDFFSVDSGGEVLSIDAYKAFKAAGAVVPRVDRTSGTIFQSGVTTSLESGRKNIARRKVADSIQDTLTELIAPYTKKLSTQRRRDAIRSVIEQYLASLVSANNPAASVIQEFSVSDGVNAGNTPEVLALGVFYIQAVVRSYASLDDIVIQTEIGENANIVKVA